MDHGAGGEAIRHAHESLVPIIERRARETYESDRSFTDALDSWRNRDPEPALKRLATLHACLLTNRAGYRGLTGSDPPIGLPPPFDKVPTTDGADEILAEVKSAVAAASPHRSVIGADYEDMGPARERGDRGQFFTPPAIASTLVEWATAGDRVDVLDPAAGTGRFLVAAARRIAARERVDDARLVGIDVDPVALHFAHLRIAATGVANRFERRTDSFFAVDQRALGSFDAIVGNPPYVRAAAIQGDRHRDHLTVFGPEGTTPYAAGDARLSKRSDIYVYFVTNATRLLRDDGRLAMILPTKWLTSEYGEGFQRFLLDQYRIAAVIGFEDRVFDDALVDTCLLFAERADGGGDIRFVRLDTARAVSGIGPAIEPPSSARARTIARRQSQVEPGKLAPYLTAPRELIELLERPAFVALGDLAEVSRGVMTGANRVFFLDADTAADWGIDDRFLRPAVKSIREINSPRYDAADVDRYLLDLHDYIDTRGPRDTAAAKTALRADGYDGVLAYIERAEDEEWHTGRTCQSRRVWFDLGALPVPDAFVPKLLRERVFVINNAAEAVPSNAIDCLTVRDGVDPLVLVGVINSAVGQAMMEVWGRNEAGMLQLMTYETATLPVPDIRRLSTEEALAIRQRAVDATGDRGQNRLDAAVLDSFDIGLSVDRLRTLREQALRQRVEREPK